MNDMKNKPGGSNGSNGGNDPQGGDNVKDAEFKEKK
jgi:hypothetical protein